jgi:hypothetical protein
VADGGGGSVTAQPALKLAKHKSIVSAKLSFVGFGETDRRFGLSLLHLRRFHKIVLRLVGVSDFEIEVVRRAARRY